MENTIDIKIIEQTQEYTIKQYDKECWLEVPNYGGGTITKYFREYNYQDVIKNLSCIPFTRFPDIITDKQIQQYLQNEIFIEDMNKVYSSYDGNFMNKKFRLAKIATIINAIQNNEYKYHLYCPSWSVNYYNENGERYIISKDENFDDSKIPKIEFDIDEGYCCIRAFIYCKKNIFVQPIYVY
jgi:hypothetical protein